MRRFALMLPVLALCGCELVKNTGEACVVPSVLTCTCPYSDTEGEEPCETSEIPWDGYPSLPLEDLASCEGRYPANTAFEIEALLYTGGNGYGTKEKCEVEVEGDRVIVKTRFWHEPERDAIKEPPVIVRCDVPPLAAGTWTLEFGGTEVEFEVGSDETQDIACALSKAQHDGYD